MEDNKLSLLNDHYKDSFGNIQNYLKLRDKLFLYVLVAISLMLFQMHSPSIVSDSVSELIKKKLELTTTIDISFLSSILWFVLLSLVIRYYQSVVYIERQYEYIHKIEDQISADFNGKAFTREGKSYLNRYPIFSHWVWLLYTIIFPALLCIIVVIKISNEIKQSENITSLVCINVGISICVILSSVFYILLVHFKK